MVAVCSTSFMSSKTYLQADRAAILLPCCVLTVLGSNSELGNSVDCIHGQSSDASGLEEIETLHEGQTESTHLRTFIVYKPHGRGSLSRFESLRLR